MDVYDAAAKAALVQRVPRPLRRQPGSPSSPGTTRSPASAGLRRGCSCLAAERWVLKYLGSVFDQLDVAIEGAVVDHLECDIRVAVVDAFCSRGAGDHREHHDAEAVDESGSQQRPAQAEAADRAHEAGAILLHRSDRFYRVPAHEGGVGPRERLL